MAGVGRQKLSKLHARRRLRFILCLDRTNAAGSRCDWLPDGPVRPRVHCSRLGDRLERVFLIQHLPEPLGNRPCAGRERLAVGMVVQNAEGHMTPKNTICLWFDKDALDAALFYAVTFPDSQVTAVHKAPADYPNGKAGDVLTVEFTVVGIPCLGLNGGPAFKQNEAFSFQIATDDQAETDRYWNAIVGNGGQESACGWCKDRWGLSWQITPRTLTEAMAAGGDEAKRAFDAMLTMKKIDVAAIEAARRG